MTTTCQAPVTHCLRVFRRERESAAARVEGVVTRSKTALIPEFPQAGNARGRLRGLRPSSPICTYAMARRLADPSETAENPLSAVLPGLPRETNMAVYDNHWSCNGSTSQLPYCIIKSISPRVATNTTRFVIAG